MDKTKIDMQKLEKVLEEIDLVKEEIVNLDCGDDYNAGLRDMAMMAKQIIRKHMNDGWISVEERVPEDGTDVLVVLKPTYESDYIEYSIARYLRFENDEAHWCDEHYGYLEWGKYSDGRGGSSQYKVIAWQSIAPYRPERSDNHDGE